MAYARKHALARFYAGLQAQATSLAYIDTYFLLAVAAGLMFLLAFTLRKTIRERLRKLLYTNAANP